jgi:hypothetical protein
MRSMQHGPGIKHGGNYNSLHPLIDTLPMQAAFQWNL